MATKQFKLPDVGEGLTEGEILQWLVAVGDSVTVNQPLCEVETAKAAVELPSPYAGTVTELLFEAGTMVDVGTPIITIDIGGEAAPAAPEVPAADGEPAAGLIGGSAPGGRTAVLVGYGPRNTEARRRPRRGGDAVAARATAPVVPPEADYASELAHPGSDRPPLLSTAPDAGTKPVRHGGLEVGRQAEAHALRGDSAPSGGAAPGRGRVRPLAKPPVRKYAKDLGVDLTTLTGSGAGGVITRADVDAAVARTAPAPAFVATKAGDPGTAGGEQRIPIKGVRKLTAAAMVASAFTAPHVTEFLTVDVTRTMKSLERLRSRPEFRDVRLSPLLMAAKGVLLAIRRHPMVNSTWSGDTGEIVVKEYVNLGI
ncbi:MAG TPA: dihydrolipoamide acetyltransferase family protein, partial [Blastococcus sp.]